jgi:hypothetical protein
MCQGTSCCVLGLPRAFFLSTLGISLVTACQSGPSVPHNNAASQAEAHNDSGWVWSVPDSITLNGPDVVWLVRLPGRSMFRPPVTWIRAHGQRVSAEGVRAQCARFSSPEMTEWMRKGAGFLHIAYDTVSCVGLLAVGDWTPEDPRRLDSLTVTRRFKPADTGR